METLSDLVARDRRTQDLALRADVPGRTYTYHDFCTTAYKAGNFLRYLGVRAGDRVAIDLDPLPEPVLTFFGAAQLGAVTTFGVAPGDDARAVVVNCDREAEFDRPPGSKLAVYDGPPAGLSTVHWEKEVWSENPAFPPTDVVATDPALATDDRTYTHAALLDAAARVVDAYGLTADDTVAIRAPLSHPGAVAAGIVAPLSVGGTCCFPDDEPCDVAVTSDATAPEARVCLVGDVAID